MKIKRIAVRIEDEEQEALQWIIDSTGGNISDAVRTVLNMATGNFTAEMVHQQYLALKRRDRERKK